jgi:hypothetical protein
LAWSDENAVKYADEMEVAIAEIGATTNLNDNCLVSVHDETESGGNDGNGVV